MNRALYGDEHPEISANLSNLAPVARDREIFEPRERATPDRGTPLGEPGGRVAFVGRRVFIDDAAKTRRAAESDAAPAPLAVGRGQALQAC
jgi:hypothetical protein